MIRKLSAVKIPVQGIGYGLIGVACFGLFFLSVLLYTQNVLDSHQELMALLATILFFGGLLLGRYMVQAWVAPNKTPSNWVFVTLALTIAACLGWVLIYVEFAFSKKVFLNILFLGLPFLLLSLAAGMLIKLVRTTLRQQLQQATLQAEKSQAELSLLQSQLSPHFLFNTLNNIYGISITQHEKVPPLLLKLSELLRYSVYQDQQLFVPLTNEMAYIHNYIDFERLRLGERLVLHTAFDRVPDTGIRIAPMLLIVFIENAFKHARNTADSRILINISLRVWGQSILFSVENSFAESKQSPGFLNQSNGLGLANATKRLQLLYGTDHALEIQKKEGMFSLKLQLKAKYEE
ncbi:MAG: sensor histidine kinase [Adhaeribacter sp.]